MKGSWSVDFTLTLDGVDHVLKELRPEAQRHIFKLVCRGILAGPLTDGDFKEGAPNGARRLSAAGSSFVLPPPSEREQWGESDRRGKLFPIERFFEKGGSTHLEGCVYVEGAVWCRLLFSGLRRWSSAWLSSAHITL